MIRVAVLARRILIGAVAFAALGATMVWGFYVHRNHVFPYGLGRYVLQHTVPLRGRFSPYRLAPGPGPALLAQVERLAQLPYLPGYRKAGPRSSVLVHDAGRAQNGLNLYVSAHGPQATLTDMQGAVLRVWTGDIRKAFPGIVLQSREDRAAAKFFRGAFLLPNGDLVAMFQGIGLVCLGPESQVRWSWKGPVHHDLRLAGEGSIWTLTHRRRPPLPDFHPDDWVWEDFVTELSSDGRLLREVSVLESFRRSVYAPLLTRFPPDPDVFHTNSVQVLDGSAAAMSPHFRKGHILISMRENEFVAILDPDERRIEWALTGQWHRQHWAHLLSSGHLLLFDNLGTLGAASRVLEIDPFTQEILWTYGGAAGEQFFSASSGFVHRLTNGNTLIGASNEGHVLEVTPDRHVVWEFVNPNRVGAKNELIASIYDLQRLPVAAQLLETHAPGNN
jgi:arylsulfotransferase ASST